MKRWPIVALFRLIFANHVSSPSVGASSIAGEKVYYDGTITVTTKGVDNQGNSFDESATIAEFKIEHWNVIPGMVWQGYASGTGCTAEVRVNDRLGETGLAFGPKKVRYGSGMNSLSVQKKNGGYIYSLQVAGSLPPFLGRFQCSLAMDGDGRDVR